MVSLFERALIASSDRFLIPDVPLYLLYEIGTTAAYYEIPLREKGGNTPNAIYNFILCRFYRLLLASQLHLEADRAGVQVDEPIGVSFKHTV